jgi:AbrB family looped-hinge helix DNA binding protein
MDTERKRKTMYKESIISKKFQVVVPRVIRQSLGLTAGDRVKCYLKDDEIIIKKAESVEDLREEIATFGKKNVKPIENVSQYYRVQRFKDGL